MQELEFHRGIDGIPGFRRLVQITEYALPDMPTREDLDALFKAWGSGKVFGDNARKMTDRFGLDGPIPHFQVLETLQNTRTLDEIPLRTLENPYRRIRGDVDVLLTGGTANLMERRAKLMQEARRDNTVRASRIFVLASSTRRCSTDTEISHEVVQKLFDKNGKYPTEVEFYQALLDTYGLGARSKPPVIIQPGGQHLEHMLQEFAMHYDCGRNAGLFVPCSANSLYIALMVRRVLQATHADFDTTGPKLWFAQNRIELAKTQEEYDNPAVFLRPMNVFSGLIRLAIELHGLL